MKKIWFAAGGGLMLILASATALAVDWVMLQGTEPVDAAPYRLLGLRG